MYSSENPTNDSIQVAYPVLSSKIYMRKYGNPGIWTEWIIFSDDATISKYQTMDASSDIIQTAENQTLYQTRFYWLNGTSYSGELPADSYKYGSAIVLKRASNSISVVIFSIGKPIYNSYSNGSWSGWRDFTGASV